MVSQKWVVECWLRFDINAVESVTVIQGGEAQPNTRTDAAERRDVERLLQIFRYLEYEERKAKVSGGHTNITPIPNRD